MIFTGQSSSAEVERMLKEADMFKEDDKKERERVLAKNELEERVYEIKKKIASGLLPTEGNSRLVQLVS